MRIRRLKLSGFKSFVEPAELRVEPGLTGVVGPNGCGKSNLLEAIRWTMGESSPKSLRGGGMDDVIFAGTATRPPRDFAEVSILLERDAPEEGGRGESEVTRRIERGAGPPTGSTGATSARRTSPCCSPTPPPARIRRRSSARARSARSSRPSPSNGASCSRRPPAFPGSTRGARMPSRSCARPKPISSASAKSWASRSSARRQLRRQARAAERYRKLSDQIRSVEARLLHARWTEAERAAEAAQCGSALGGRRSRLDSERDRRCPGSARTRQCPADRTAQRTRGAARAGASTGAPTGRRTGAARYCRSADRRARPARRCADRRHCA